MNDIQILEPIIFTLNITESEELLGSFKANINLKTSISEINFTCWFLYESWNNFIIGSDDSHKILESIDKDFKIEIKKNEIVFEIMRKTVRGEKILFKYQKAINEIECKSILDIFAEYPKWW